MKIRFVLLLFISMLMLSSCGERYILKYTLLEPPPESSQLYYSDKNINVTFGIKRASITMDIKNNTKKAVKINWDDAAYIDTDGTSKKVIHSGVRLIDKGAPQAPSTIPKNASLRDFVVPIENIYYEFPDGRRYDRDPYYREPSSSVAIVVGQSVSTDRHYRTSTGVGFGFGFASSMPSSSTRYLSEDDYYGDGGWYYKNLFYINSKNKASYIGRTFGIYLPVEIDGDVKEYTFIFKIQDVITQK